MADESLIEYARESLFSLTIQERFELLYDTFEEAEPQELLPDGWEYHDNLVQRDLELFEAEKDRADKAIPVDEASLAALARNNRRWIQAAIKAGWFKAVACKVEELPDQKPGDLKLVALSVSRYYQRAVHPTEKKF